MYSEKMGSTQHEIEGRTLDECKNKLFQKYGNKYEIINFHTTLKGGFLGFFQREGVTVNYVVDDRFDLRPYPAVRARPEGNYYPREGVTVGGAQGAAGPADSFTSSRNDTISKLVGNRNLSGIVQVAQLSKQIEKLGEKLDTISEAAAGRDEHPSIVKIDDLLAQNEFTSSYIKRMNERIRNELSLEELDDFEAVQEKVVEWIGESIKIAPKYVRASKDSHVIVIVGPTGVGKTTTIAKMAAKLKVTAKNKKLPPPDIHMITIDSMRVGAEVQLSHYGEIMEVNVDKAETSDDLKGLFDRYKSEVDFIFIDTSGYSPRDLKNIARMHGVLDVDGMKADIYLAVSASTKARDLENIIRNYESFDFRSVIITKCDETSCFGNVLSVLSERNKSISMITNGQQVLHFLERARPMTFLKSLTGFQVDWEHLEAVFGSADGGEDD